MNSLLELSHEGAIHLNGEAITGGKPRSLWGAALKRERFGKLREGKGSIMFDNWIYVISVVLLIGVCGLGYWFARQSLGFDNSQFFAPKHRRLGVVEATHIGGHHRLLLIRRDDVEHLILTGGPVDVVIETGIGRDAHPMFNSGGQRAINGAPGREAQGNDLGPLILDSDSAIR